MDCYPYREFTDKENEAIDNTVRNLMHEVNRMGFPHEEIARRLARQHRTLQQAFMHMAVSFIQEMAKADSWDLRNEASVKFAKEVVAKVSPDTMCMPFI